MITFENGIDLRCRQAAKPTVAKFRIVAEKYAYVVIGTAYGYWHTSAGDVRTWATYSGARRAALRYEPL